MGCDWYFLPRIVQYSFDESSLEVNVIKENNNIKKPEIKCIPNTYLQFNSSSSRTNAYKKTDKNDNDASNSNMDTFQSNKYVVNLIEHKTYLPINFADRKIRMVNGYSDIEMTEDERRLYKLGYSTYIP